jgi:outer membrane protein OmpA-like peptidoglycan-associated protein
MSKVNYLNDMSLSRLRRVCPPFPAFLLLCISISACAGGEQLMTRNDYIETQLDRIHDAAYQCAERELALAESHHDFGAYEITRGDYLRALDHVDLAYANIEAAIAIVDANPECWPDFVADRDGDGFLDNVDACPDDPEDFDSYQDDDGCPELDNDEDGYLDTEDNCPDDPEDFDLYADEDGCPDLDNDADGIQDIDDLCPNEPEDVDGFEDEDGCPEEDPEPEPILEYTVILEDRIEITEQIHFAHNSSEILSESYPILLEINDILSNNPTMELRIEGHTDSSGSESYNLDLSERRAASVREFIIDEGTEGTRLISQGLGELRPIEDNQTSEGRAANRRVEFHIITW